MKLAAVVLVFAIVLSALLFHFAALETFNFVVPKDDGSKLLAQNVPFGNDPRLQ